MSAKYFLYLFITIVVIWAMGSINLNGIFKKNKIWQARILYFLLALSLIYLVTNFIWDFFSISQFFNFQKLPI